MGTTIIAIALTTLLVMSMLYLIANLLIEIVIEHQKSKDIENAKLHTRQRRE